jgi:hypothetical protein
MCNVWKYVDRFPQVPLRWGSAYYNRCVRLSVLMKQLEEEKEILIEFYIGELYENLSNNFSSGNSNDPFTNEHNIFFLRAPFLWHYVILHGKSSVFQQKIARIKKRERKS